MKSKYTIAITGASGMLGREVGHIEEHSLRLVPLTRKDLDITNRQQCLAKLTEIRPDAILHCAAYTAVDQAETDEQSAYVINVDGTRHVAEAANMLGCKMLFVSTDYVFDGRADRPYATSAPIAPTTVYGKSKWEGEQVVRKWVDHHFIVRTSWLFGRHGSNFVETMLRLGRERGQVSVVADQIGSPTSAYDLAHFMVELVRSEKYGTYHAANAGSCSWYQFALGIFGLAGLEVKVDPCATEQFPRPARRPAYSVLDCSGTTERGFMPFRPWEQALEHYFAIRMERGDG